MLQRRASSSLFAILGSYREPARRGCKGRTPLPERRRQIHEYQWIARALPVRCHKPVGRNQRRTRNAFREAGEPQQRCRSVSRTLLDVPKSPFAAVRNVDILIPNDWPHNCLQCRERPDRAWRIQGSWKSDRYPAGALVMDRNSVNPDECRDHGGADRAEDLPRVDEIHEMLRELRDGLGVQNLRLLAVQRSFHFYLSHGSLPTETLLNCRMWCVEQIERFAQPHSIIPNLIALNTARTNSHTPNSSSPAEAEVTPPVRTGPSFDRFPSDSCRP